MSSGTTEFLDWTGPVERDTTFTDSGQRWNNTNPVGQVGKSSVQLIIPAVNIFGVAGVNSFIVIQYNYTALQPFSLLDYNSVANVAAFKASSALYTIRHRVNDVVTRYTLFDQNNLGNGEFDVNFPIYNGQIIKPQFVIEAWVPFSIRHRGIFTANPITLNTSMLSVPSPYVETVILGPATLTGTPTTNLFIPFPAPLPIPFDASGPWNSN